MSRQILNGWKEISSYIKRSVRTVQRWEARLDLPVYRPALKDRSAVVAFSDELDRWIARVSPDAGEQSAVLNGNEGRDAGLLRLLDSMNTMLLDTAELSSRMRLLQEQLGQSLRICHQGIAARTLAPSASVSSRALGPVLTFRPQRSVTPEQMIFRADGPAIADRRERAPGHAPLHAPVEKAR
jgi:hypothetical protein